MISISPKDTAVVVTDPQNDALSPGGAGYELMKVCIEQNNTIVNLSMIMKACKDYGYQLVISPHALYPHDNTWMNQSEEEILLLWGKFYQKVNNESPSSFGADYEPSLKPYICDGRTIIANPHKIAGPQTNDLALQLRKHGISKVILCGCMSNICVESHMRDLTENGFQIAIAHDATAAPGLEAYNAAMVNFKAFASASWSTTDTVIHMMNGAKV